MRVEAKIVIALCDTIDVTIKPSLGSELYLFGSRVDIHKKGGDIDLLLVTDELTKRRLVPLRLSLKAALREAAGDQKVDFTVASYEQREQDPFLSSIHTALLLKKW